MKKFSKKLLSLILAVLMMVSVMPMGMMSAQAANGVQSAISNIAKKYGHGSYFSTTRRPCGQSASDQIVYNGRKWCKQCNLRDMDRNTFNACGMGDSCWAFGHYVFYNVFKCNPENSNAVSTRVVYGTDLNKYAKVGDYIRADGVHSFIYMGAASGGYYVYDSNGKVMDGSGAIQENRVNYMQFYSFTQWFPFNTFVIYHANNYDAINGVNPVPPSALAATTPSVKVDKTEIAVGKNVSFSWTSSNAVKYNYELISPSGKKTESKGYTSNNVSKTLDEVGKYKFTVTPFNANGVAGTPSSITCTTHAKVNVQFVDWDGNPLTNKKQIDWNSDIQEPVAPSRKGYTFQSWDSSTKNITSDRTIKALYKINTYTVRFFDKAGKLLKSEKVDYDNDATPPTDTNNPIGYNFLGWDSEEYKNVYTESSTRIIDIHGIYAWFNDDLPVVCQITSAQRQDDGYYVYFDLTNYDKGVTRGRAVVSLKTAEGKLVDTTESTAFSIPVNGTKKGIEVFVPCDSTASKAEVIIVNNYSSGVPISKNVSTVIDQGLTWTDWSPEKPDENNEYLETDIGTQYRFSDKQFTTSTSTNSLSGWTLYNTTSAWGDYGGWSSWSPTSVSASSSRQIQTRTTYRFHAFASSCSSHCRDPYSGNCDHGYPTSWQETWQTTRGVNLNTLGPSALKDKYYCHIGTTKWWYERDGYNNGLNGGKGQPSRTEYSYRDRKLIYTYHFYKWNDWSNWTADVVKATDDRKIETRTVYRYKDNSVKEDNTGVVRTAKGKLDKSFAGKQITLYVYGYIGASDFTNYYIGQSVIADDGSYSFIYKLREEPTELTGDYTVAIGIEGTTNTTVVDTIEAPKPKYTVNFYDWDGTIISTQTVTQGQDAVLPSDPTREGFDFKGWDKSITNVQEDMDVFSDFAKKEYEVIFVDWANQTINVQKYEHGDILSIPDAFDVTGYTFEGWDQIKAGNTVVTSNMVVSAEYKKKTYTVKFLDFNGNVIETQKVEYGAEAKAPETVKESDGKQFAGWFNPDEYQYVEDDVEISPAYYFEETTEIPTVNYDSGEYSDKIQLTLTSSDKNAVIFYYLNDDQSTEKIYTKPITIDKTCSVTYYATSFGKNDSVAETKYFCINSAGKPSAWMLYSQIPQEVKDNTAEYNLESEIGYRFKDVQSVSTSSEAESLVDDGWTFDSKSYSAYTSWQDEPISVDSSKIGFEVDTQEVADTTTTRYQYSHYKYVDNGVTKYSNKAVDGFDCEYETTISDTRLSIAGFTDDNVTYYQYNGQQWFNQTRISGVKTQYRSRYQIAKYYKWTKWDVVNLSSNETREYEEQDLFRYSNVNYHLVNVVQHNVYCKDSKILVVKENTAINLDNLYISGYDLEGLYLDEGLTNKFESSAPIQRSVTVYPKYTPKTYTVSFQMLDGTEIDYQEVEYMHSAIAPDTDAVPGFVFGGWEDKFDSVTEDMVIYGRYYKESEYARISLDKSTVSMYKGTSIVLTPTITPANLSDTEIQWSTSDSSIADVNDKGVVNATGTGEVTITAMVVDTKETASCTVTVNADEKTNLMLKYNSAFKYDALGYLRGVALESKVADVASEFKNDNIKFFGINGSELTSSSLVGTGTQIKLFDGSEFIDVNTVVITGDMTGDGLINNRDVAMMNRYLVQKTSSNECQRIAVDVNGDGYVNNRDAAMLARYLVGKETLK